MKVKSNLTDAQSIVQMENRLAQALFDASHFLAKMVRPYAPVRTGALRESIDVRPIQFVGVLHEKARVSPGVSYDIYQELGTYKMPPHPYLKPATRDYREAIVAIIANGVIRGNK